MTALRFHLLAAASLVALVAMVPSALAQPAAASTPDGEPRARVASAANRVTLPLAELSSSADALRLSTRASETLSFNARADQLLTAATLELPLERPAELVNLRSLEIELNGEPLRSLKPDQLEQGGMLAIPIDAGLLASSNLLAFHYVSEEDPAGCGRVPAGSWRALARGTLALSSASLPLPTDLEILPLPFYDPRFDREQTLQFVFGRQSGAEQLYAANLVASWFALQGSGRLSFSAHLGSLPRGHAVVFVDDLATASALGLTVQAELPPRAIELRAHPANANDKLLVLWGLGAGGLTRVAKRLLQDGNELGGPLIAAPFEITLPALDAHQVPRWVTVGDVVLGALPEKPSLRAEGGTATTLRIPFRISPAAFAWPRDWVELELGYSESHSSDTGPAHLHVALNGQSIGVLPQTRHGRTTLRVPRTMLRGFNELLVQISHPERKQTRQQECRESNDDRVWVQIEPDSTLRTGTTQRFAMLPDLNLFLYDGFPLTEHGDLRETQLILPSVPTADEVATMLSSVAHLTTITGHASTGLTVTLGTPSPAALLGHDALLIAGLGRHPLLQTWSGALPLAFDGERASAHHPASATLTRRLLSGRIGRGELERAQQMLEDGPYGAVMGVTAPWDAKRSLIVMTGSEPAHMPHLAALLDYADAVRQRNDLLLLSEGRRALFQLSSEDGRGELPRWLALRWWLAHYWVVLVPTLLLAALALGVYLRITLARIAAARVDEVGA